jgi:hypothetical protein
MNWHDFDIATVRSGKTPEGVRYLELFLKDYTAAFGGKVNPTCPKCLSRYLSKYKSKFPKDMKKVTTNGGGNFLLKTKYEGLQIALTGVTVNNRNITDEMANDLMAVHAPEKIFSKFPEGAKHVASKKTAATASTDKPETNRTIAAAENFDVNKANVEKLTAFAKKHNIALSATDLKKADLVREIKVWLDSPKAADTEAAATTLTNREIAEKAGFDLATATLEEKAEFIDTYDIPFTEKEGDEKHTPEEVDAIITDWLEHDPLG